MGITLRLKNGETIEGFLFNREYSNPKLNEDYFIEVFLKGNGERRKYSIPAIQSVELTGEDCAAGKSYEDYRHKQKESKTDE